MKAPVKRHSRVLFLLAGCLSLTGAVRAQDESAKRVILDHADTLVGTVINGEDVRLLQGHVKFHQKKTIVTCDTAVQFIASGRVSLEGTVKVYDDSATMLGHRGMYYSSERAAEAFDGVMLQDGVSMLRADYGKYYLDEKKAYFRTNVRVEDTATVMTSDELTYFRESQIASAQGRVKIVNKANGLIILGNHFENYRKQNYSRMMEHPVVIQTDTSAGGKTDTLIVLSRLMESYKDSVERLVATDSVVIVRSDMLAEAGLCTMLTKLDSIILRKLPFIWYTQSESGENQVSGDSIFIRLKERKLETAYVRGRACAISRADSVRRSRFNQMTGQEMIMHFADNKVEHIDVDRTATSLYYLYDEGKANGMNRISGDHITITFSEGKIGRLKTAGGVIGEYFPEKLVKGRESDYNLDGFNWKEQRPARPAHLRF